jgi:hypothetical protein
VELAVRTFDGVVEALEDPLALPEAPTVIHGPLGAVVVDGVAAPLDARSAYRFPADTAAVPLVADVDAAAVAASFALRSSSSF